MEFDFNKFHSNAEIYEALGRLVHYNGSSNTDLALEEATKILRDPRTGVRDDAIPKVVIILTDGHAIAPVRKAAGLLPTATSNTTVFAVGILNPTLTDEKELADLSQNFFTSVDNELFEIAFSKFVSKGCPEKSPQKGAPKTIPPVRVTCSDKSLTISAKTANFFYGLIYVGESFSLDECQQNGDGTKKEIQLTVLTGSCPKSGLSRKVSASGEVLWTGYAVLQFHPKVMSDADRRIEINCLHKGSNQISDAGIG